MKPTKHVLSRKTYLKTKTALFYQKVYWTGKNEHERDRNTWIYISIKVKGYNIQYQSNYFRRKIKVFEFYTTLQDRHNNNWKKYCYANNQTLTDTQITILSWVVTFKWLINIIMPGIENPCIFSTRLFLNKSCFIAFFKLRWLESSCV